MKARSTFLLQSVIGPLVVLVSGCGGGDGTPRPGPSVAPRREARPALLEAKPVSPETDDLEKRLLKIASTYRAYGRVDDEVRWAPWLCRLPIPSRARFSASEEEDTHGRKLYFVFAADRNEYLARTGPGQERGLPQPSGQVLVKESWIPRETPRIPQPERATYDLDAARVDRDTPMGAYIPYAEREGRLYHASEPAGLFIMMKTPLDTPGTDRGWVYGTVAADGRTVTSVGRVPSCMRCHEQAPCDRLFGMAGVARDGGKKIRREIKFTAGFEPRLLHDLRPGFAVKVQAEADVSLRLGKMEFAAADDRGAVLKSSEDGSGSKGPSPYEEALGSLLFGRRRARTFRVEDPRPGATKIRLQGKAQVLVPTRTREIAVGIRDFARTVIGDHSARVDSFQAKREADGVHCSMRFHLWTEKETLGDLVRGMNSLDPSSFVAVDETDSRGPCSYSFAWGSRLLLLNPFDEIERVGNASQFFRLDCEASVQKAVREIRFRWIEETETREVPFELELSPPP